MRHAVAARQLAATLWLCGCWRWQHESLRWGARGETDAGDKAALLAFYDGLTSKGSLEGSWRRDTDPCDDGWVGVVCGSCVQQALGGPGPCEDPDNELLSGRVTGLLYSRLGSVREGAYYSKWTAPLLGPLSPRLAELTQLRVLNLGGNQLSGSVPPELGALENLEQLLLGENQLHGTLPPQLGDARALQLLSLSNNILNGSLPVEGWCNGSRALLQLEGNIHLCGYVPECLAARLTGTVDTSLISRANLPSAPWSASMATCCGATPPRCESGQCGVAVPRYWTNNTEVRFAFSPFEAVRFPGIREDVEYYWTWSTSDREPIGPNACFIGSSASTTVSARPRDGVYTKIDLERASWTYLTSEDAGGGDNIWHWVDAAGEVVQAPARKHFWALSVPLLNGIKLTEGVPYYIYVIGVNQQCPNAETPAVSASALVIVTPPADGLVFNSPDNRDVLLQQETDRLGYSYTAFQDPYLPSSEHIYLISVMQRSANGASSTIWGPADANGTTSGTITGLQLERGSQYYIQVTAINLANLEGNAASGLVTIAVESNDSDILEVALGVTLGVVGLLALLTGLAVWWRLRAAAARELRRAQEKAQLRAMRALMEDMTHTGSQSHVKPLLGDSEDQFSGKSHLVFVVTDIEGSTVQSMEGNKPAFEAMMHIHNTVMRHLITKYGGYEVMMEGDSFQIAFTEVEGALHFCVEAQYRLLDTNWPAAVLKLPSCKTVYGSDGNPVFNGPRVRIGVHWATEGTYRHRLHPLTKHWVFSGPGFDVAKEVGDAANGGQILITDHAWVELSRGMAGSGWPVVNQIGLFTVRELPDPTYLYEVQGLMGARLRSNFQPPRGLPQLAPGLGFALGMPPIPMVLEGSGGDGAVLGTLSFVACQLNQPGCADLPEAVGRHVDDLLAICALQYQGYMYHSDRREFSWRAAFADTLDATRFAHAAQAFLLASPQLGGAEWPEALGGTRYTADGRLLFRGPRVAMAIVTTADFEEEEFSDPASKAYREYEVRYSGEGLEVLEALVPAVHGGQVVLEECAWQAVYKQLPQQWNANAINVGAHLLLPPATEDAPERAQEPMMLMEVMPGMLEGRSFPPPRTYKMLSPGFRESPDPNSEVTVVFFRVSKPREVIAAEEAEDMPADEQQRIATLQGYNLAIALIQGLVRELLPKYGGYECKEPEPGKFTLAFSQLQQAVLWCSAVQLSLLEAPWPPEVLGWAECAEQRGADGQLLWRGLRVRCGSACGIPNHRKPLATGRADYWGAMPNLAARVCALAAPGQALLDVSDGVYDALAASPGASACGGKEGGADAVDGASVSYGDGDGDGDGQQLVVGAGGAHAALLSVWGHFRLKGFELTPRMVVSIVPLPLRGRVFDRSAIAEKLVAAKHTAEFGRKRQHSHNGGARPAVLMLGCSPMQLPGVAALRRHRRWALRARRRRSLKRKPGTALDASILSWEADGGGAGGGPLLISDASDDGDSKSSPLATDVRGGSWTLHRSASQAAAVGVAASSVEESLPSGSLVRPAPSGGSVRHAILARIPRVHLRRMPLSRLTALHSDSTDAAAWPAPGPHAHGVAIESSAGSGSEQLGLRGNSATTQNGSTIDPRANGANRLGDGDGGGRRTPSPSPRPTECAGTAGGSVEGGSPGTTPAGGSPHGFASPRATAPDAGLCRSASYEGSAFAGRAEEPFGAAAASAPLDLQALRSVSGTIRSSRTAQQQRQKSRRLDPQEAALANAMIEARLAVEGRRLSSSNSIGSSRHPHPTCSRSRRKASTLPSAPSCPVVGAGVDTAAGETGPPAPSTDAADSALAANGSGDPFAAR